MLMVANRVYRPSLPMMTPQLTNEQKWGFNTRGDSPTSMGIQPTKMVKTESRWDWVCWLQVIQQPNLQFVPGLGFQDGQAWFLTNNSWPVATCFLHLHLGVQAIPQPQMAGSRLLQVGTHQRACVDGTWNLDTVAKKEWCSRFIFPQKTTTALFWSLDSLVCFCWFHMVP